MQCGSEELRDRLDEHLWTWREESFLPHAADGAPSDGNSVWLTTTNENPIAANIRFLLDDAEPHEAEPMIV